MISVKNEEVIKLEAKILKSHHIFGTGFTLSGNKGPDFVQHKVECTLMEFLRQKSYSGPNSDDNIMFS